MGHFGTSLKTEMNVDGRGSELQRWKKGQCPNPGGRPSVAWLKALIETEDPSTGKTKRQSIAEHLLELATSYSVIHCGRDLELASGRDSVEAAKLLFSYCYGKPPPSDEEQLLRLAEHLRGAAKDAADLAIKVLGTRLYSMSPAELGAFLREAGGNPGGFLEAAKAMVEQVEQPQAAIEAQVADQVLGASSPTGDTQAAASEDAPVLPGSDEEWPKP